MKLCFSSNQQSQHLMFIERKRFKKIRYRNTGFFITKTLRTYYEAKLKMLR